MGDKQKGKPEKEETVQDFMLEILQTLIAKPWLKLSDIMDTPGGKHLLKELLDLRHCSAAIFFGGVLAGKGEAKGQEHTLLAEETSRLAMNLIQAAAYAGAAWAVESGITSEALAKCQVPEHAEEDESDEELDQVLKDFLASNKPD